MRVLVTGGTGFVGSHIARRCLEQGYQVRLLVRDIARAESLYAASPYTANVELVPGDVTRAESIVAALDACQAVVHCAAATPMAGLSAEQLFATNVTGVSNVMDAALARGIPQLIHISSITAIFNTRAERVNEASPVVRSRLPYGRSKAAAEQYLRRLQAAGHPVSIIYPAGIIGPDDPGFSDGFKSLYHRFNTGFRIFQGGMQNLDVRDLADCVLALIEQQVQVGRLILPGPWLSWTELADLLEKVSGATLQRIPARGWVLRTVGRLYDLKRLFTTVDSPLSAETMRYATQWPRVVTSARYAQLGLRYREPEVTFTDSLRWMLQQGYLKAEQVPLLADE